MNIHNHFRLSVSQQTILIYLEAVGGKALAIDCMKRSRGVYGYLNDLRFLEYIEWEEPLTRHTEIILTPQGQDFLKWQFPTAPDDFDQSAQLVIPLFSGLQPQYDRNCVFVLMPFKDERNLQAVYADHIKAPLEERGFQVGRADNVYEVGDLMQQIWSNINRAAVIIADMTDKNPNVFYEVGVCHALGKSVILLSQDIDDVPFDLRSLRVIVYDYTPRGTRELEKRLMQTIDNVLTSATSLPQRRELYQAVFVVNKDDQLEPLVVNVPAVSEADAFDKAETVLAESFKDDADILQHAKLLMVVPADAPCFRKGGVVFPDTF